MEITIDVNTKGFEQAMFRTAETINYFLLKKAFQKAGISQTEWYPWSHYLWEGDWNSQRPKIELTMKVWDPIGEVWV